MRKGIITVLVVVLLALSAVVIYADPLGPTSITSGPTSRYSGTTGGYQVDAYAGNVTQLDINGSSITLGWQGYYGNVVGTIVLADSNNDTLYDWNLLSPSGEVYASRGNNVDWSTINCSTQANMSAEETALNFSTTAKDGINETFASQSYPSFFVGNVNITSDTCYNTNLHNSSGVSQANKWYELILSDDLDNVVYTSLLENNADGFNGTNYDFQMIVAEDGHNGDVLTTPYYFWVELQ